MRYPVECYFCECDIEYDDLRGHLEEEHYDEFHDDFSDFVDNEVVDCNFCENKMPRFALERHEERKHECEFCNNRMPTESLQRHIDDKHAQCGRCGDRMNRSRLEQHIKAKHRVLVGSIFRSNDVSDGQMNQHIANNNVFVENGFIYLEK